jgi:hypothetical protein
MDEDVKRHLDIHKESVEKGWNIGMSELENLQLDTQEGTDHIYRLNKLLKDLFTN